MWGTVFCVVLLGFSVALLCVILLFAFALFPQAKAFGGQKWWSYVLAVMAVLFEAMLLALLLLKVVHSKCQKKIFVTTMELEGAWKPGMIEPSLAKDINCCRLGFFVKIITFPLNLIPVVGTFIFAFVNAPFEAWDLMDMYFDAIQMDDEAQVVEVTGGERAYCSMYASSEYVKFGFIAMLLESIPVVGPAFFSLSNACGAALWAVDMEARGGPSTQQPGSKTVALVPTAVAVAVTDHPII